MIVTYLKVLGVYLVSYRGLALGVGRSYEQAIGQALSRI